jgi:hypothetical protein
MTKSMTKSMTKWGNDKVYPPPFIVQECLRHSADLLLERFGVCWGQTEGILAGFAGKKEKKLLALLGADRRHSLRVRALKRREKNKNTEGILSGFAH